MSRIGLNNNYCMNFKYCKCEDLITMEELEQTILQNINAVRFVFTIRKVTLLIYLYTKSDNINFKRCFPSYTIII